MSQQIVHDGGINVLPHPASRLGKLTVSVLPYAVLYALAVALIAMTDHNPASAQGTWDYFIPLVGLVSIVSSWHRHSGDLWQTRAQYILRQLIHWGAVLLVIHLLFQSDVQHFLRAETDGFVIVYILGLASLLSGLYLDWQMAVFGLFLIFSSVILAYLDDNALLIAIGGIATLTVVATALVWIRHETHRDALNAQ